jgi:hypothetical protein
VADERPRITFRENTPEDHSDTADDANVGMPVDLFPEETRELIEHPFQSDEYRGFKICYVCGKTDTEHP